MITKVSLLLLSIISLLLVFDNQQIKAETENIYTQDFVNIEEVKKDFGAYYLYTMGGQAEESEIGVGKTSSNRWYLDNGTVNRQAVDDDIRSNLDTNSIGILTLEKQKYLNFELTVDYKKGSTTDYWPVIAVRQSEVGKYYLEDGMGIFLQKEGFVTIWGTDGVDGPYQSDSIPGYTATANDWHTLKIVLEGLDLKIYVDDLNTVAYQRMLPNTIFKTGYISLVSVNNDSSFRNLKIKELPVEAIDNNDKQEPIEEANSDDALSAIATSVDKIDELKDLHQGNDKTSTVDVNKIIVGITGTLSIMGIILILIILINRKFKERKINIDK